MKFINIGVPQGSNLGPLLFLLFINDLPNCLESVPRLFADDTCLQVCAPSVEQLELKLNSELTKICKWMSANKLTLNASKSQALIISPKLKCSPVYLNLQCPAGTIKSVNNAKYLGITLDNRLNFHEHIKITETKVARSVGILSKLKYYLPESAMLQLYYSLVHSQLIYGVAVWGNTFPSYLAKLTRLQNKALRLVTSSDWNASAAPLYQKLNILSLSKLNKFEIAKFIFNYNNKCLPTTFDQHFILAKTSHSQSTRYSASDHLKIPLYKTNRLQRSIKFVGPKI